MLFVGMHSLLQVYALCFVPIPAQHQLYHQVIFMQ